MSAYRNMLLRAFNLVSGPGRSAAATIQPSAEKPRCPEHPESCVAWSNLRESYRCLTCRKLLGNPDPGHVGADDVI